jgi:hypothetical protein
MSSVNLWLCEHLDFQLVSKLNREESVNVLVHGAVLSKFKPNFHEIISPISVLSNSQMSDYARWVIPWDRDSRARINNGFIDLGNNINACKLDSNLYSAVERLFYHCKFGCVAAVVFFSRIAKLLTSKKKVRVIVGENYRMTELMTLVWWVSLCNRNLEYNSVEFVFISRKTQFKKTQSLKELLFWISESCSVNPKFQGDISPFNGIKEAKTCVAWVSTIRFHRGWKSEMDNHCRDFDNIFRITQFGQSNLHESPCLEINAGNGGSLINLEKIQIIAEDILSQIDWNILSKGFHPALESVGAAVEKFFISAIGPYVLPQISKTADLIEEKLSFVQPTVFYSAAAPLMESLGVHEWVSRKSFAPLPFLLPHSFTPSHEFPAAAYQSLLSFISSKELMPTVFDDPDSIEKEQLVSLEKIQGDHSDNLPQKSLFQRINSSRISGILKLPKTQLLPILLNQVTNLVEEYFKKYHFSKIVNSKKFRLGLLLNFEHYEFCIGLDFIRFFQSIAGLSQELEDIFGEDAALILRRKPGWTNMKVLENVLLEQRADSFRNTLLASPQENSLLDFGKGCDLVFCFQGTSAIPELMMCGIPCVFLKSDLLTEKLDVYSASYIVLPKHIVPHLDLKTVKSSFCNDPNWTRDLGQKQKKWIKGQMSAN